LFPPVRRSSELRRVRFGQYIAELQRFRPDFEITEHPHQYFLVNFDILESSSIIEVTKALPRPS